MNGQPAVDLFPQNKQNEPSIALDPSNGILIAGSNDEIDEPLCSGAGTSASPGSFRRGLATNLHLLHVDDKTIQAILRHSNISLTMNVYVKSVAESGVNAMDLLGAELRKKPVCNDLATSRTTLPN